jgi:sulfopropanediol 3-dehydrogenase
VPDYIKEPSSRGREADEQVRQRVFGMLARIERERIAAVRHYSREFDDWDPPTFRVGDDEIRAAARSVPEELKEHIAFAQDQVRTFAEAQRATLSDLELETLPGVVLGHRHIPVGSVGAYVPGGRYPMFASAFMTILVAKVAGVPRVAACTPPQGGRGIDPLMLYAIATSGADEIYCLGGVQAVAALALETDVLSPVDMIVGAGNAYVAEAKRQLFGRVGIDLLAGPTEIVVIADAGADPELVAADLLGQAEHGPTSPAGVITTDAEMGRTVSEQVERLLPAWPTAAVAGQAWRAHGWIAVVAGDDEAIALADEVAPEHLELQVEPAKLDLYLSRLTNDGSLFVGSDATVVYGDKAIGTNHVLPTGRAARYTGGLWVGKFLKTVTYQRVTDEGTRRIAPAAARISDAENFAGHALTARMRLERLAARSRIPSTPVGAP